MSGDTFHFWTRLTNTPFPWRHDSLQTKENLGVFVSKLEILC